MQPRQLAGRVIAVAGKAIDLDRFQQTNMIVIAQGGYRNLHQLGEFTDPDHCPRLALPRLSVLIEA